MRVVKIIFVLLDVWSLSRLGFRIGFFEPLIRHTNMTRQSIHQDRKRLDAETRSSHKLTDEGIMPSYAATLIYLRTFGDASKLQAGEYQFPSPITPLQVLKELEKGETQTTKLTIPEGFTRFDIAKRIAEKFPQNPPADDKAILTLMDDVS